MNKSKMKSKKGCAEQGDIITPWDQMNMQNIQYPQYNPIYTQGEQRESISPMDLQNNQMQVKPIDYSGNYQDPTKINNLWNSIGKGAATVGRTAGKVMSESITYGLPLLNALIPEQTDVKKYRPYQPPINNPYSMGINGSQAIYENGGTMSQLPDEEAKWYYEHNVPMPKPITGQYITSNSKKHNIQVTEELPDMATPYKSIPTSFASQQQLQNHNISQPKSINYHNDYDINHNLIGYTPNFTGFNHNQALENLRTLPDSIGGLPVTKSPQNYAENMQNFTPDSNSYQWSPYSMNYGGKMKKKAEYGTLIPFYEEGKEYDLDQETINQLRSKGYEIE